jgi:hypothetical protein
MKNIFTITLLCLPLLLCAQKAEQQALHLTTHDWQVGYRAVSLKDAYLSPLVYAGNGISLSQTSRHFFLKNSEKWISISSSDIAFYSMLNPALSASMLYLSGSYDYGVHCVFRPTNKFRVLAGGSWDADLGFKYLSRNSNNPFNMDLSTNWNISAAAQLKIPLWQRVFQAELKVRSPFVGVMFVPQNGATYYEMTAFDGGLKNTAHFSHLGNKNGIKSNLAFDIPLNHWTIRIAGNAEYLEYKANKAFYFRQNYGFSIGIKYDFLRFSGRKNLPTEAIFLSPND